MLELRFARPVPTALNDMKFEKPQKGNPHSIVVSQHVFPRMSIERFSNEEGFVQMNNLVARKILPVKPTDKVFCASRAWDQRAEAGYMKLIEDDFQRITNRVIDDPKGIIFSKKEIMLINRFYALWVLRHHYSNNPEENEKLYDSGSGWTKDEQEQLEKAGVTYVSGNGEILGRHLTGSMLQTQIGDIVLQIMDAEWGVIRSCNLEFIVPDRPLDFLAVPINPNLCLYSKSRNVIATDKQVAFINYKMIKSSKKYYFARNLAKCLEVA